jgi:3-hydroxybutyryl-CoA dehydrogenase
MGEGIAQVFAQHGFEVRIVDINHETLIQCPKHIKKNLDLFEEYDLLNEPTTNILARIATFLSLKDAVFQADFIIEAVSEKLEIKQDLLRQLDHLPPEVIIASNTSSIPITQLTEKMSTVRRVVGVHYFNPAHIMPLVEIHFGKDTEKSVVEATYQLMIQVGKKPILIRKALPGFAVNRITGAMMREIYHLLEEGVVTPEDLDIAVKNSLGFKLAWMGPMANEDLAGLDIASKVHSRTFKTLNNSTEPSPLIFQKVDRNELGVKSGQGWLNYHGKTREEITYENNRMLVKQLCISQGKWDR